MAHTPGPWRVHSEHADRTIVNGCCVYQVGNLAVPDSYEPGVMGAPNPDDVRLMAAAPEMLKTLRFIVETMYAAAHATPRYDSVGVNILLEAADEVRRAIRLAEEGRE